MVPPFRPITQRLPPFRPTTPMVSPIPSHNPTVPPAPFPPQWIPPILPNALSRKGRGQARKFPHGRRHFLDLRTSSPPHSARRHFCAEPTAEPPSKGVFPTERTPPPPLPLSRPGGAQGSLRAPQTPPSPITAASRFRLGPSRHCACARRPPGRHCACASAVARIYARVALRLAGPGRLIVSTERPRVIPESSAAVNSRLV